MSSGVVKEVRGDKHQSLTAKVSAGRLNFLPCSALESLKKTATVVNRRLEPILFPQGPTRRLCFRILSTMDCISP